MPRLNLYEMANPFRAPRSSGADFGAAPAQAMEGAGNAMFDIGERIQRREENAISDQVFGEVNTQALPLLNDFEKKHDIALPQALNEFQGAMQKIKADAMGKANLRPEARAALERQLDNQITQYGKSAIGMRIKAGNDAMVARLNEQFDTGVNQVGAAPSIMKDVIDTNVAFVESRKDSMDPLMYQAAIKKAHAGPIQAAVNSYLAQQLPDKADELLQNPEINKLIDPDALRPLRINVAVEKGKQESEVKRQDTNVQKFQVRLGRPLTPEETLKARSLPAKKDMTPADEITELELVQNGPASQDQVDKIFKTYVDKGSGDSQFGSSIRGRSVDYVTKNSVRYSNGLMTPEEARVFEASVVEAYAPVKVTDPLTGVITTREVTMPGFVKEAMNRGGSFFAGAPATGDTLRTPGDMVRLDINGQVIGQGVVDASGKWTIPAPPEPTGAGAGRGSQGVPTPDAPPAQPAPLPGLYDNVPFVAGPTAKLGQTVSRTPLIGQDLGLDPRYVTAQKSMDIGKEQLSQALRPNSKIADTYRQELMKLVDITGKTWDNPEAMWLDIQTIDKELRTKLTQLENIASGKTAAPIEDRKDALEISNAIRFSLQRLDVPQVKVNTKAEYDKLAPGTRYLFRDDPKPLTKK
jgi:hypothetical protein